MIEEFKKYVSNYNLENKNIKLKYEHSFRVMEQSVNIAKSLGLDETDKKLAEIIGLLHDFGRFEQLKVYNTYNDSKSIDHANYSVDVLFNNGEIRNYIKTDSYDNIIKAAIKNHNKFEIEGNLTEKELLHSCIVRDADKIDILYLITILKEIVIKDTNDEISKEVIEQFNNKSTIKNATIKNNNDRVISYLSFVYDINYIYTIKYILNNKIMEKYYGLLDNKEMFKPYFDEINKYMVNFIREGE